MIRYLQSKLYIAMLLCLLLFWKIAVYLLRKPYDDLIVSSNYMHCSYFLFLSFESFSLSSIEVVWLIYRSKQTGACFLPRRITIEHNCLWSLCLKFIYSEKATKFCEISTLLLSYVVPVKSKVEISQNFVAFSEYMNFNLEDCI